MSTHRHHRQAIPRARPGRRAPGVTGAARRRAGRPGAGADRGRRLSRRRGSRPTPRSKPSTPPRTAPRSPSLAGRRARLDPDTRRRRGAGTPRGWRRAAGRRGGAGHDERPRAQRVRARAPARAPRRARPGDGLLPAQQRRHRRRGGAARGRGARADRRLGRPPRQRHAGHLRRARRRALHVGAPVSVLSGHRRRATRSASARAAARPSTARCPAARATRTTASCSTICSCPRRARSAPDLVIVSAGFDAHARDPLAGMRVSERGFAAMASVLAELADEACGGKLALMLEGGYDLAALTASVRATLEVMAGRREDFGPAGRTQRRWTRLARRVRRWPRRGAWCRRPDGGAPHPSPLPAERGEGTGAETPHPTLSPPSGDEGDPHPPLSPGGEGRFGSGRGGGDGVRAGWRWCR